MEAAGLRVGLLAYGQIGHEHNLAVQATDGLSLVAVCDQNPQRLAAALELAPNITTFNDADSMLDSGLIDLVIISTPPNSHFAWAAAALSRGIHVVVEKPMALSASECDQLMAQAEEANLLLVVYQNRRFDADYVTMAALIKSGVIGEVFHYESFVGGYTEPCRHWHTDAEISGGAIFDWGSHFLDQALTILPSQVDYVSGVNHKRHWNLVTNADHAHVTITFVDGTQATFIHSDLAAARKPKFYALGTKGAIVGDWDVAAEPKVADLPAILSLHHPDGTREPIELLSVPPHSFHASIVEYINNNEVMSVTAQQSRDVVAVMEAAEASAKLNGLPVVPNLLRS
jgi:predicted dehydrogenase